MSTSPSAAASASSSATSPRACPPSLQALADIPVGGAPRWDYLSVDSAHHRLYVAHGTSTEVLDTGSGRVVATLADTDGVHGIALAPELGLGFVSDGRANAVTVFELATSKARATIAVGTNPDAILYDPATQRVMTFNGGSHDISVIDARQGRVVATVALGGKPEFAQLGADGSVWVNVEDTNELLRFDPGRAEVRRRVPLAPCEAPSGLAVDEHQRLYAVCENRWMVVVGPDGRKLGQAPIGAGADGVAWLDGAAYSANGRDGTISVVREVAPGRFETVETVASAPGARTIAADPAMHRLYLPTAQLQPAASGARPGGIAGTFHVLVFEHRAQGSGARPGVGGATGGGGPSATPAPEPCGCAREACLRGAPDARAVGRG